MADLGGLLDPSRILLHEAAADRTAAVRQAGELLVVAGAVDPSYTASMLEREDSVSTYMGEGVAIPHGTAGGKAAVRADAMTVVRYPAGVDWGNGTAHVVIGIAAVGEGHLPVLAALAEVLTDPERATRLRAATEVDEVLELLTAPVED